MITTITGIPGHGKSLWATKLIMDFVEANKNPDCLPYDEWVKQYQLDEDGFLEPIIPHEDLKPLLRPIYSDIRGMNIEGVKKSPLDYNDCEDGAVIFYDECQKRFGPDGKGRSGDGIIQSLETHRHRGFDIFLITQHPKLLHAHIRRLVGKHYHVHRMHGGETAKIFQRDGQIDVDRHTALEKQDNFMWSYDKKLYGLYKSATIHTHKKELPKWLVRGLIGLAVGVVLTGIGFYFASDFFTGQYFKDELQQQEDKVQNASAKPSQTNLSESDTKVDIIKKRPVACISSNDKCVCYDSSGFKLNLKYYQCREYTEELPQFVDLYNNLRSRRAVASAS